MLSNDFWLQGGSGLAEVCLHYVQEMVQPEIEYGLISSPLGECLTAFTTKGLCWFEPLTKSDVPERLMASWQTARLSRADERVGQRFAECLARGSMHLHLVGTQFQLAIWSALRATSPGETLTYSELAHRLNKAGAARAVGGAVAANHIAGFVPCHRVVPAAGGSGEFRWGRRLKQQMLAVEGGQAVSVSGRLGNELSF
jgi:AraC family transcriptional regulator of adaptative response/methylated-DNA-[protein]-cysteine methyltransferase